MKCERGWGAFLSALFMIAWALMACDSHTNSGVVKVVVKKDTLAICAVKQHISIDLPPVPVLCYHRIEQGVRSNYRVSPTTFESHMKTLSDSGFQSISPDQLYDFWVNHRNLPSKPMMLTFDDSRVEHFTIAAPLMEKYGFRGVFFIMTITCNKHHYLSKSQIAQLAQRGHVIGLHSWDHTMGTHYQTPDDWIKQVIEPRQMLQQLTGQRVNCWAYPNGVFDHQSAQQLSQYFQLSFILADERDTLLPLQTVRRIIVPDISSAALLRSMHRSFKP